MRTSRFCRYCKGAILFCKSVGPLWSVRIPQFCRNTWSWRNTRELMQWLRALYRCSCAVNQGCQFGFFEARLWNSGFSWTPLAFFGNQKKPDNIKHFLVFFQSERLGSGKTLSELHTNFKSLLKRVYKHAGCRQYWKTFAVALKMINVTDKKQMYDSVITSYRCFWRDLMSILCFVMHDICLYALKLLSGFFWWKQIGNLQLIVDVWGANRCWRNCC